MLQVEAHFAPLYNPTRGYLLEFLATVPWRVGDQGKGEVFERGIFQNYSRNATGSLEISLAAVGVFMNDRSREVKDHVFGLLVDELEENPGYYPSFKVDHLFGFDADLEKEFLDWVAKVGRPPVQHVSLQRFGGTARASIVEVSRCRVSSDWLFFLCTIRN